MKITLSIQNNGIFSTKYTHIHIYIHYTHIHKTRIYAHTFTTLRYVEAARYIFIFVILAQFVVHSGWKAFFCPTRSKTDEVLNKKHTFFRTTMG
jgi:hypothetical protein